MLQKILKLDAEQMDTFRDATDALAAAYCHYMQMSRPRTESNYRSWKDYVKKNADKVSAR